MNVAHCGLRAGLVPSQDRPASNFLQSNSKRPNVAVPGQTRRSTPSPSSIRIKPSTVIVRCNGTDQRSSERTLATGFGHAERDNDAQDKGEDRSRVVSIRTLPLESTYDMAISSLLREIESLVSPASNSAAASALTATIRIEVPLPRGLTSLQWLKSQDASRTAVYFSTKQSSAPDTEGSSVAEGSFRQTKAVAGLGHAWMWRGRHGCGLDEVTMGEIAMMTDSGSESSDIKVLGGSRFDPNGAVGEEWAAFGSFCFFIPRIEYVERGNGCVLACTLAWDAREAWKAEDPGVSGVSVELSSASEVHGFATMQDAVRDALRCISELKGAAPRNSAGVIVRDGAGMIGGMRHEPDAEGWRTLMDKVQQELSKHDTGNDGEDMSFVDNYSVHPTTALDEYLRNGQKGLDELLAASKTRVGGAGSTFQATASSSAPSSTSPLGSDSSPLSTSPSTVSPSPMSKEGRAPLPDQLVKLVLARKTSLVLNDNELNCCDLLEAIQEKDPKAYQFMLRLGRSIVGGADGRTFLGCTPERLYCRTDRKVVSEAVAGTRGRGPGGDIEKDFWLAFDLLQSQKDGLEFQLVRESIVDTFERLCDEVDLEVDKSILKQGSVQHLYGRIAGSLRADVDDLDLVRELHPTPAVCGQPDQDAMCLLRSFETFDRGFYAGPFGWFSKNAADIAVAIRSSLVGTDSVNLYAGVGIVPGSVTSSEWNELDLKISQFTNLFGNSTQERIMSSQNLSILAAQIMVEELCRCGCNTFCVAPGSRSSPLTLAVAQHPRARLVPGIDERSLGFWALGHGKATGRPCVVITSSGTAVANLLPAVVEASQSDVPLILLTADRPAEMRDSGANQTIDQVGIFGKYVRWEADLLAPSADVPLRSTLAAVSNSVRISMSRSNSGPVHLNCQFREPLHPVAIDWKGSSGGGASGAGGASPVVLQGLDTWIADPARRPFTLSSSSTMSIPNQRLASAIDDNTLRQIMTAERGLIVVGELADPDDVSAAKQLASYLRWPVVGDVLSGLRIGASEAQHSENNDNGTPRRGGDDREDLICLINNMDHMLLGGRSDASLNSNLWDQIKPDVVLHLGTRLTSKRLLSFLEWTTQQEDPSTWILANRKTTRYDPANVLSVRLDCSAVDLHRALTGSAMRRPKSNAYASMLARVDKVVGDAIDKALGRCEGGADCQMMSEAHVAKTISECLPDGDGLFVGNSMPIRDLDMFGCANPSSDALKVSSVGAPIAANRGASGIDGVLSSAAGFADGLQRKCTLVIGDVSFIHDTNGLNLLRTGGMSPALTVVLINNSGGGIFNFLPIAGGVPDEQFRPLWTTPQYVDVAGMCRAQGIPHMRVTSLTELERSLQSSWALNRHCVLEVITNIDSNVGHHEDIKEAVLESLAALDHLAAPETPADSFSGTTITTITRVRIKTESFPLKQPLTTVEGTSASTRDVAHIMMDVFCPDGTPWRVIGEVAPLPGLHRETLHDAIEQATCLAKQMSGVKLTSEDTRNPEGLLASMLRATLGSSWHPTLSSLYPSVACGLEAAMFQIYLLNNPGIHLVGGQAINSSQGNSHVLPHQLPTHAAWATPVSALLNPLGKSVEDIMTEARGIVSRGYNCIKVKAGRVDDPEIDAQYLRVIRDAVGDGVALRVDANQAWTAAQAATYVGAVADLGIEYLEEPLADPMELLDWKRNDVPIALDESIDQGLFDPRDVGKPLPEAVKFAVVKPSLLGGLSETLSLSRAASSRGLRTIISSSFESPLGLLHLSQIAQVVRRAGEHDSDKDGSVAHGISTESWFQADYSTLTFCERRGPGEICSVPRRLMPAGVHLAYDDVTSLHSGETESFPLASFSVATQYVNWHVTTSIDTVGANDKPIVLLHGMFGSSAEMHDLASALRSGCPGVPVLCVDLPGHGKSRWTRYGLGAISKATDMLDLMSLALTELLQDPRLAQCTLVGYSLGARLALSTYLRERNSSSKYTGDMSANIERLFMISGGLGVEDPDRQARAARDDAIAASFETLPREEFFNTWYGTALWDSMRDHPGFAPYVAAKAAAFAALSSASNTTTLLSHDQVLAATLRGCSPGRVASLRDTLELALLHGPKMNIHMMIGSKDAKYMEMASSLKTTTSRNRNELTLVTVDGVGHAMHLEAPNAVASLIAQALRTDT